MGVQVIPIPTEVVSHSLPFPFLILCFIPIPMGFPWNSRSHWESHSQAHLYHGVQYHQYADDTQLRLAIHADNTSDGCVYCWRQAVVRAERTAAKPERLGSTDRRHCGVKSPGGGFYRGGPITGHRPACPASHSPFPFPFLSYSCLPPLFSLLLPFLPSRHFPPITFSAPPSP